MSSNEGTQQQPPHPGHRKHPCVLCQQRKVKCDRSEPCGNCNKAGVDCVSAATLPPRKRKRRFPEAELLARLRRYEHHLRNYGADIDAINREGTNGDGGSSVPASDTVQGPASMPSIKSSNSESPGPITSVSPEEPAVRSLSVRRSLRHVENNLNLGVNDEFRDAEELLQGSSDDEMFANPVTRTYEELGGEGGDLLFGPQHTGSLKALHPSPIHIFRLWQTFLDNINPLIKIFHAPSVQQKVLDATADLEEIPRNTEALLFGIYATAMISMDEEGSQKLFGESKQFMLARFQSGGRQALRNAGFLRSSDIVVLQAFTLYLLSCLQMSIDPRSLFCLTGVAVRIAQRMGLSTDGTNYAIPPFEVEMRRRLWWQIILIDSRVAELSGAGSSILTYAWSTKLPSNINDSDLFPDMRDPPVESPGITEMIFVRLRCEIIWFVHESRSLAESLTAKDDAIDEFEQRIEREYLSYCDPLIPLHVMSAMMAGSAMCKLRMGLRHPHFMMDRTNGLSPAEKDKLFELSLRMLENHNSVVKNPSLRRYIWHIYTNFPFPAHVYLLCALRYRTNEEFADRAWQQLSESAETRMKHDDTHFFAKKKDSFIHLALGNMVIKAWEARQNAFPQALPTPRFVSMYRKQLAEKKSQRRPIATNTSPVGQTDQAFDGQFASQFPMLAPDSLSMGPGFDQPPVPHSWVGMFPNDLPPTGWEFWDNMIQAGDSMQGIDAIPPPYNYYQS